MATVKCPLGKRGTPSHEWHDGEKSRIYCHGWIDSMTDELLEACRNCPDHVNKAQDDLDKWNAEHRNGQQLAVKKRLIYADNPYWRNVCNIADRQREKGVSTYGQGIEKNPADIIKRIEYLEEELVDALMYCEWIKDWLENTIHKEG